MRTEILSADAAAIERAAQIIRSGGVVAFPTETVYGLGADALNEDAVRKIFTAKERPFDDPLIVHIAHAEQLSLLARHIPRQAWDLTERFWPGPLTLVLPKTDRVPTVTAGGLDTVAVRAPAHPVARSLIERSGVPIAAPSANRFGRPSPTTAQHVWDDLNGRIDLILDGGPTPIGVESTVLDLTQDPPMVLRPGGVTLEELREVLGEVRLLDSSASEAAKRSPGTRYRHYAPKARVLLVERGMAEAVIERFSGQRVGVLVQRQAPLDLHLRRPLAGEDIQSRRSLVVVQMPQSLKDYARRLFAVLRELDAQAESLHAELVQAGETPRAFARSTFTAEETAYFLNLTIRTEKPIVVVCSQRPHGTIGNDGDYNLVCATRVAIAPQARGQGVLLVMDETILPAREVLKTSGRWGGFKTRDVGPLGYVEKDGVTFYRSTRRRHTAGSEFDITAIATLPRVDVVYAYPGADEVPIRALVEQGGAQGLVVAGLTFSGAPAPGQKEALQ
ncbi:MAG: threonylcarbamoyl-AMP synthase, partial [Candidatus Bipolaricaulota bacterium]|nr:threonylcarbamoyl-AMP synthase [Candidatus Bipolaricaulota bacterium]